MLYINIKFNKDIYIKQFFLLNLIKKIFYDFFKVLNNYIHFSIICFGIQYA